MIRRLTHRILRDERGDIDEVPVWTVTALGTLTLILFVVFVGRAAYASNTIQAAANAAARDASISRTAEIAVPNAQAVAYASLGGVTCIDSDVQIGGNGLSTGLGQTGTVTATITCTINMSDLVIPGAPGSLTITKTATSPVDPYRAR